MKLWKRMLTITLAAALLLGRAPRGLPSPVVTAQAAAVPALGEVCLKGVREDGGEQEMNWNTFVQNAAAFRSVHLTKDVVFRSSDTLFTHSRYFRGTFSGIDEDGVQHTITVEDKFHIESSSDGYAGLIPRVYGGTVQNVVVMVEGTAYVTQSTRHSDRPVSKAGLLVGSMEKGTLSKCAIISTRPNAGFEVRTPYVGPDFTNFNVGGLVGSAGYGTRIDNCYSDIRVRVGVGTNSSKTKAMGVGGLAGELYDASSIMTNCAYFGDWVAGYAHNPKVFSSDSDGRALSVGGLVGRILNNAGVSNSYVKEVRLSVFDIDENTSGEDQLMNDSIPLGNLSASVGDGSIGLVAGSTQAGMSNVYGTLASNSVVGSSPDGLKFSGVAGPAAAATAAKLGPAWANVNNYVNLSWLVNGAVPEVAVTGGTPWPPTLTITPDPPAGNRWLFDVSVPVLGRMPTAQPPQSMEMGGGETVSGVTVAAHGSPAAFYAGASYDFVATLAGVSSAREDMVAWSAAYKSGGDIPMAAPGRLAIPADAAGREIVVTAAVSGNAAVSGSASITPVEGALEITLDSGVPKGGSVPVDVKLTAAGADGKTVTLTLEGAAVAGTKLENNLLTVAADETATELTVKAVCGTLTAEKKIAVETPGEESASAELAAAPGGSASRGGIHPGQKVKLTVTAPTGVTDTVDPATAAWTVTPTGSGSLDSDTGATVTFTAPTTGFVETTVTAKVTAASTTEYTAAFTITPAAQAAQGTTTKESAADGPQAASHVTPGASGGTGGSNTYRLTFAPHLLENVDLLESYNFGFVKQDGGDDTNVRLQGTGNNPKNGISFKVEVPPADSAVYLQLYISGNAKRADGEKLTYKIPLSQWTGGTGPSISAGTASQGSDSVLYKAEAQRYEKNTPADAPDKMDLSKLKYTDSATGEGNKTLAPDLIAEGSISVSKVRLESVPYGAYYVGYFLPNGSGSGGTGGRTNTPVISPGQDDTIDEAAGITISVTGESETVAIYYTTSKTTADPPRPDPDNAGGENPTKIYSAPIAFPKDSDVFIIRAVAVAESKLASAESYIRYNSTQNIATPDPPGLRLDNSAFDDPAYTYEAGRKIHFTHPYLEQGTVYFTMDGREPTEGNSEQYKKDAPIALPGDRGTEVIIKAFFKRTDLKTPKQSETATFRVRVRQPLDGAAVSIASNTAVGNGAELLFTLSEKTLSQLDSEYGTENAYLQRVVYKAGTDSAPAGLYDTQGNRLTDFVMKDGAHTDANGDTIETDLASAEPKPGTEYINCVVDADSFTMPELRYLLTDGDPADKGSAYSYGLRLVTRTDKTSESGRTVSAYTVSYRSPQVITLSGEPGSTVTVKTAMVSKEVKYANSAASSFVYRLLDRTQSPTAFPAATEEQPGSAKPGDIIRLTSKTSNAVIYYTVDNTMPDPKNAKPSGVPGAPGEAGTWTYIISQGIPMPADVPTFYTIRAVAVAEGLDASEDQWFIYELPEKVRPVLASPNGGTVVENTKVTLSTTTEGAAIYYTTDGVTQPTTQSQPYSGPITVTKNTTILAIAEKDGMVSNVARYDYKIAGRLEAPAASLKSGSVVYKGTRIHLTSDGSIAYTVDGSDPTAILADAGESSSGGSGSGTNITITTGTEKEDQVLFGDSVVIDADFGKSVTVRAFSYGDGHTPSEVAAYTYTVCEEEDYLAASPAPEEILGPNSQVTLTSSLSGSIIYYSVGDESLSFYNRFEDDGFDDREDEELYYKWSAGGDSHRGSTVRVTGEPGSTFIIRATALQNGAEGGTTRVFTYRIAERTPAPTSSIPSGAVVLKGAQAVLTVKEGTIFYTTDGTDPTTSSALYTGPIPLDGSMVLKAIASVEGKEPSAIVQYVYTYAGQAAAPTMSVPGGEIEQGTRVELSTATEGAAIYYTTDGSVPTTQSSLYTAPITIMRPVTLKAVAALAGLHDSVVNTATYTVYEPPAPEDGDTGSLQTGQTDRLASRRSFSEETAGPSYTDVVLTDQQYNAVLSGPEGSVPKDARLVIRPVDASKKEQQAVETQMGYRILQAYSVTLERGGEPVRPEVEVELGLPIPSDYRDGIVEVCKLNDDGTLESFTTRRSGGIAYVKVSDVARYAVAVPEAAVDRGGVPPAALAGGLAAASALIILLLLLRRGRKRVRLDETETEEPDEAEITGA